MADITMCRDDKCIKRKRCYRFTAPVDKYRQTIFSVSPRNLETKICDYYWPNKDRKGKKTNEQSRTI